MRLIIAHGNVSNISKTGKVRKSSNGGAASLRSSSSTSGSSGTLYAQVRHGREVSSGEMVLAREAHLRLWSSCESGLDRDTIKAPGVPRTPAQMVNGTHRCPCPGDACGSNHLEGGQNKQGMWGLPPNASHRPRINTDRRPGCPFRPTTKAVAAEDGKG